MARPKKKPEPEVIQGVKNVTRIEKYQEPVSDDPPVELVEEDQEEKDDRSPIEKFFDRVQSEQGVRLRVERLPLYRKDGKAWLGSPREFVTNIDPFTEADIDTYEADIQRGWGGGDYRCEGHDSKGVITSWVIHLANPPVNSQPAAATAPPPFGYAPAPAPIDPAKMVREYIAGHLEFQKLLNQNSPAPAARSNGDPSANIPLGEYVELKAQMAVIDRLTALQAKGGEAGDAAGRLLLKLAGVDEGGGKGSWIGDLVKVAIEMGPIIIESAYRLVMALRSGEVQVAPPGTTGAAGPPPARGGLSLVAGGAAPDMAAGPVISINPETAAQRAAEPTASDVEAWGGIVRRLIYDVRNGRPTHLMLDIILEEEGNRPELRDAIGFIRKRSPEEVLTELQRTDPTFGAKDEEKSAALRYFEQLQTDFNQVEAEAREQE